MTRPIARRAALALPGLAALPARAQAWPMRQLTLIAPFTPGGPVDVLARALGQGFQAQSGQAAVVENRTGANGNIGIEAVRRAAPDGHTLLVVPAGNMTINPTLMPDLPYAVERDFATLSFLASTPNLILVAPGLGLRDLAGLAAAARGRRGGLAYGSPGVGSQLHLTAELMKRRLGIEMLHVPYRGTTAAINDLLSGQIQLLFSNLPAALPVLQGRRTEALALTTAARTPFVPEVPTLAELGLAGIDIASWYGLFAPRATPAPVQEAIIAATRAVLNAPAMAATLTAQGLELRDETGAAFGARIARETASWAEVIRNEGIRHE
jgi:tripartite-type tricarboxylate transporter receptor subunit TctC